jgi:hypothetical protein
MKLYTRLGVLVATWAIDSNLRLSMWEIVFFLNYINK